MKRVEPNSRLSLRIQRAPLCRGGRFQGALRRRHCSSNRSSPPLSDPRS